MYGVDLKRALPFLELFIGLDIFCLFVVFHFFYFVVPESSKFVLESVLSFLVPVAS